MKKKAQNLLNCCLVIYSGQNQKMIFYSNLILKNACLDARIVSYRASLSGIELGRIGNIKIYVDSYNINRMRMVFL